MAPRRGGGGGGGGYDLDNPSGPGRDASCANGFETEAPRVMIAFYSLYFVVFLGLTYFLYTRWAKNRQGAGWLLAFVSILFGLINMILSISFQALRQCEPDNKAAFQGPIAVHWFSQLMKFLLMALILVPVGRHLHEGLPSVSWVTRLTASFVAILGAVMIASLGVSTAVADGLLGDQYESIYLLEAHDVRLRIAYYVFEVVGMLLATGVILAAVSQAAHLRARAAITSIAILILSSLGMTLVDLGGYIYLTYGLSFDNYDLGSTELVDYFNNYYKSLEAQTFLRLFFYSVAFVAAVIVRSRRFVPDLPSQAPSQK